MGLFTKKEANLENLRVEHVDVYNEAVAVGVDQGKAALVIEAEKLQTNAHDAGVGAGAVAERARIEGINACTITGHEALAKTFIADGTTTPGEAAIKMINANKALNVTALDLIKTSSAKAIQDEKEETVLDKTKMTTKEKWDADPKLAEEFDSYAAFEAVEKNAGNYRIKK